jgi:ATP-dependent Zn protease
MTVPTPSGIWRLRTVIVVIGILLGLVILYVVLSNDDQEPLYAYSDLLADAAAGEITAIEQGGTTLYVFSADGKSRTSYVASESINVYAEVCAATGRSIGPDCSVYYAVLPQTGEWVGLLVSGLVPLLVIGAFLYFMMRQVGRSSSPTLVKLVDDSLPPDETAK